MRSGDDFLNSLKKRQPIKISIDKPKKRHFFYLKKSERYQYLQCRIQDNKKYFMEIMNTEFEPANIQHEKSFLTYGCILVTPEKDIYIYNNDNESNDTLVRLNLNHYNRYSLFNGQLVVIRGKNIGNNELLVQGIHCLPSLNYKETKPDLKCHIKILHESSKEGNYDADIVIFIGCDVPNINKTEKNGHIHFIHIPTMEDPGCIEVYPMNYKSTDKSVHISLNNPCQFKIQDKIFSINTLQVLDLLKSIEISKNEESPKNNICGDLLFSEDTIERLCYHLIFQRSYLPLLNVKKVCYKYEDLVMPNAPDYYIIRSEEFDPFVRDIGPTKIINIGRNYSWDIKINGKETKMILIK